MGCASSTPDKGERDRSYEIDKQIEEDSRKFKKECKILLLGESLPLSEADNMGIGGLVGERGQQGGGRERGE